MCHSVFGMVHAHQAASCHYVIVLRQVSLHCMQVGAVFCSEVKPGCRVRPVNKMDLRVEFFPRFWGDWRCVAFVRVLCSCERELCVCVATLNMLPCCRVDDCCSHHHVDFFESRASVCFLGRDCNNRHYALRLVANIHLSRMPNRTIAL